MPYTYNSIILCWLVPAKLFHACVYVGSTDIRITVQLQSDDNELRLVRQQYNLV